MSSKPITKAVQDMPPKGGYPPIDTKRRIRPRGPSGLVIWLSIAAATAFGFVQIGKASERSRNICKESREARMAVLPFIMAEQDIDVRRRKFEAIARDAIAHK